MRRLALLLAAALLAGCWTPGQMDEMLGADRCAERGGVFARVSTFGRDETAIKHLAWYCFKPDTISLAIPRGAAQ